MKNEKKYPGVYLDNKTGKYYVSTTFMTKDGYAIKKCKRGFDTAKKADTWKNQTTLELANTSYETTHNVRKGMEKLIYEYLEYKKATTKPSSLKSIHNTLIKYFLPFFKMEAKDVKVSDITKMYQNLANSELSNLTKNRNLGHMNCFIDYLDITESMDHTMIRKFKLLLKKFEILETNVQTFTRDEIDKILDYLKTAPVDFMRVAISILARTGCRLGECLGLKFSDLNSINNTITFNKQMQEKVNPEFVRKNIHFEKIGNCYIFPYTKTNSTKIVVIPEWLTELILEFKQLKNASSDDYIFRIKNIIYSADSLRRRFKTLLNNLNIPHKKIHALRHFHTTELYDLGFDPKYIAERLGHADETTSLKIYKHLSSEVKNKNDEMATKLLN